MIRSELPGAWPKLPAPVIIDALRTPIGTTGGIFSALDTTELAAPVLAGLAERQGGRPIAEVVLGSIRGPGGNPARVAALAAGIDPVVPAVSLDRQCGAGLAALEYAWHRCRSVPGLVLAGGVQAASTQPVTSWPAGPGRPEQRFDRAPFAPAPWQDPEMGLAADLLAEQHEISRQRQDGYALRSHQRAVKAQGEGAFEAEIIPLAGHCRDERPRAGFTPERLARFRPAFRPGGTVTAANSCGVNDGAAAVAVVDGISHAELGVPGLRVLAAASVGCDPDRPGWGIVAAVREALSQSGIGQDEVDVWEFNEAFAGQVLACADELGIDERRLCPQGGAIALGHPWAASGAVLMVRLFSELVRTGHGGYGVAAIAIGGGQGSAMVVQAC